MTRERAAEILGADRCPYCDRHSSCGDPCPRCQEGLRSLAELPPGLATTLDEARLLVRVRCGSLPHWCAAAWGVAALVRLVEAGLIEDVSGSFVLTSQARARLDPGPQAAAEVAS